MQTSKFPLWICALALCGGLTLHAEDTPAQAAARAALSQKMQEIEANPAAAAPAPAAVKPAPATPSPVTIAPAASAAAPAPAAPEPVVMQSGDTEAQARARAALSAKMGELGTPVASAPVTTPASKPATAPAPAAGLQPITAPALPINMTKAGKLEWLLSLYKTDQITPEQYHKQRAEILAQP